MENKLYRSRSITHLSGDKFETPLLIPSFSSKGFSIESTKTGEISECFKVIEVAKGFLEESLLISAYDLYHKLIPEPKEFKSAKFNFIDSGGYETSQIYDLSGINKYNNNVKDWDKDKLVKILKDWPVDMNGIVVSYDHGELYQSLQSQVDEARKLFYNFRSSLMSTFLIKPEKESQTLIQLSGILANPELLQGFDIIGVTEKEIGNSQLDRMINIALLRQSMDKAGITAPIHVFGSLDPLNVILYFLAGAEIFDGLTWLKFAYVNCAAVYIQNYTILSQKYGIETKDTSLKRNFWVDNLSFLDKLKYSLINFHADNKYEVFSELDNKVYNLSQTIEKIHVQFLNKLKSK